MRIIQFQPWHLEKLTLQPSQIMLQPDLASPEYGHGLASAGPAYSGVVGDEVFACMGLIPQWPGRAIAWGLIAGEAGPHFVSITKAVYRTMVMHPFQRIETAVAVNFENGCRWAEMLGFKREGLMKSYTPNGDDCYLYARVRTWKSQ